MMPARTYSIETERLLIRCYHPADAELVKQAVDQSLDHLLPWMPWANNDPEPVEQKRDRLREFRGQFDLGKDYVYGIFNKDESVLIGSTGLHTRVGPNAREIGYWIHKDQVKKGYATEAVKALIKVGFEIESLERIEIHCDPQNYASQAIPEKLGFEHEATLKNRITNARGQKRDAMIWSLFREQYEKAPFTHFQLKAFDVIDRQID